MAYFAATDVTYALQEAGVAESGNKRFVFKLTFGNGSLEYATGGIPITKGKLGCANNLSSLSVMENAVTSGYVWDYDVSESKLKGFYGDFNAVADGALIELPDTTAIAAQEVWVEAEGW